jgi:hypothetical protein
MYTVAIDNRPDQTMQMTPPTDRSKTTQRNRWPQQERGLLVTPLTPTLILLPLLGIVLNGTSSVFYGTVPKLAKGDTGQAFAVFYTSVIGSGGIAPILYGAVADHSSQTIGVLASAATAALIVPLVLTLRPHHRSSPRQSGRKDHDDV